MPVITIAQSAYDPRVVHFRITDITKQYFPINHLAGNIDMFYNGVLMIPEIVDSRGTYSNTTGIYYDFQSGNAVDDAGTSWVAASTAGTKSSHIKLSFTLSIDDWVSIRSY
jgi:hypothetical protein|tara:strand:- start:4841 stop:5173 length:333 start_codon:yes stop_codon:yes gene_type:complete